jgi:hypothetical protein
MAILTAFNIGKDTEVSIRLLNALGFAVPDTTTNLITSEELGLLTRFSVEPQTGRVEVKPINNSGIPGFRTTTSGVKGTLEIARNGNPALDSLYHVIQDSYYGVGRGVVLAEIVQKIYHPLGANSGQTIVRTFMDAVLMCDNLGEWRAEEAVSYTFSFESPQAKMDIVGASATPLSPEAILLAGIGVTLSNTVLPPA